MQAPSSYTSVILLALCAIASAEPGITAIDPIGGQRGTPFEVEAVGTNFQDVTEVLFHCPGLAATPRVVRSEKDKPPRLFLKVEASADARVGWHRFRLLARHGVSRPWQIFIGDEPDLLEKTQPEGRPQKITVPCSVHGGIGEAGDADYYAFEVNENETLSFELVTASGFLMDGFNRLEAPDLRLLKPGGSWFDPDRSTVVLCQDLSRIHFFPERTMQTAHLQSRLIRRFEEAGTFLLRVTEQNGFGSDYHSYQLRVRRGTPAWSKRRYLCADAYDWQEHEFHHPIDASHLEKLWSRTAREPDGGRETLKVQELSEIERGADFDKTTDIQLPALITGRIAPPGDIDDFRFSVQDGDALAFEIRTTETERPYFSPRLRVENLQGREVFSNTYRKIGGDGDDWIKSIEAKALYEFKEGGEYILKVQDWTARHGGPDFAYKVFARKQVPHMGKVTVNATQVNVPAGGSATIQVDVHREEGFQDVVAVDLLDLPEGVDFLPADRVLPDPGPPFLTIDKERFVATIHSLNVLLVVREDAPPTPLPRLVRVTLKPLLNGKPGPAIVVKELPVMITY